MAKKTLSVFAAARSEVLRYAVAQLEDLGKRAWPVQTSRGVRLERVHFLKAITIAARYTYEFRTEPVGTVVGTSREMNVFFDAASREQCLPGLIDMHVHAIAFMLASGGNPPAPMTAADDSEVKDEKITMRVSKSELEQLQKMANEFYDGKISSLIRDTVPLQPA